MTYTKYNDKSSFYPFLCIAKVSTQDVADLCLIENINDYIVSDT